MIRMTPEATPPAIPPICVWLKDFSLEAGTVPLDCEALAVVLEGCVELAPVGGGSNVRLVVGFDDVASDTMVGDVEFAVVTVDIVDTVVLCVNVVISVEVTTILVNAFCAMKPVAGLPCSVTDVVPQENPVHMPVVDLSTMWYSEHEGAASPLLKNVSRSGHFILTTRLDLPDEGCVCT